MDRRERTGCERRGFGGEIGWYVFIPTLLSLSLINDFLLVIVEIQATVNPITSKMYGGGAGESHTPGEEDEEFDGGRSHDEL